MEHNRCLDVFPDNCVSGTMREPAHWCGATSKSCFPTFQASSCAQHPSNTLKLNGKTVCLPSDHVVQIHDGQCLSITFIFDQLIRAFFWSRRTFPHPLRRLHLGFNIVPINPCLISCYDFLKKVFITICIGKQFLCNFSTVLFLIVSQNLMARSSADAHFVSNFSDS